MLVNVSVWAWLGVFTMAVGTAVPVWAWYRSVSSGNSYAVYYATLASVTGIAALAYFIMALGFGTVATVGGDVPVPRYVDWLLTTPLLLLYLGLLARPPRRTLFWLIAVDIVIIAAGIAAVATAGSLSWALFGVGVIAYIALIYGLLITFPRSASRQADRVRAVFGTLRNITVVLWTLYPVVWVLAPTGFGLLTASTEMLVFVYLDVVSKVGFVIIATAGADALTYLGSGRDADTREPGEPAMPTVGDSVNKTDD